MDVNIVVAVLGLIVAVLAESRTVLKDKKLENIRPIGIGLLQLLLILDKIIITGEQLTALLASIPLDSEASRIGILGKKWKILELVKQQQKNINDFAEVSEAPLAYLKTSVPVRMNDAVSLLIPDKIKEVPRKKIHLQVLTWKLLEGEAPFSRFSLAARAALSSLKNNSVVIDLID